MTGQIGKIDSGASRLSIKNRDHNTIIFRDLSQAKTFWSKHAWTDVNRETSFKGSASMYLPSGSGLWQMKTRTDDCNLIVHHLSGAS